MRRAFFLILILGVIAAFIIREIRLHQRAPIAEAYVGAVGVTVWNTDAPVRVPVANLPYGAPLKIYVRSGDRAQVRTAAGATGWVSTRFLLEPSVWHDAALLDTETRAMPVEAVGHSRVRSNIHTAPGRGAPVILEIPPYVPVELYERKPLPEPQGAFGNAALTSPSSPPPNEDWWLVRAHLRATPVVIAGWMLGRFISLDLPDPLSGYASSAGINVTAWFQINRALGTSGELKPEYLVLGTHGPEGQPCDFTLLRVYTWSDVRQTYETAFVDSNLCGALPVSVTPAKEPGGRAFFRFQATTSGGIEEREFEMQDTRVRLVRSANAKKDAVRR